MGTFLKNYATPLGFVAFLALGTSGVLLLVGIRNHDLGEVHEKLGLLFVIAAILHSIKNRKALAHVLSQTRSKILVGALGILAVLAIGSALLFAPSAPEHSPTHALEMRLAYTPINTLAPALGLSSSQVISRLRKGGVTVVGPGQNLADVAQKQGTEVSHLLDLIVSDTQGAK